jgi:prepilin-type N-terminal cleavage/methylation domain-containing protein
MPNESRSQASTNQGGFTLLELLVAMTATLIVTGAMYGLMVGGKSAFRREPELSDRQQQIRIAMALIERDVLMAGQDMGRWFQVFSPGLDSFGPVTSVVTPAQGGPNADALELRGNDGLCPNLSTCQVAGGEFKTFALIPPCMNIPGMVVVTNRSTGASDVFWACVPGGGTASACGGGGGSDNGHVGFPGGSAPNGCNPNNPGAECNQGAAGRLSAVCPTDSDCDVSAVQSARYEIRVDAQGVPDLWRSPRGGITGGANGACAVPPGDINQWQLVARGIEDMQVQYRTGNPGPLAGGFRNVPEPVVQDAWATIVQEVQVTLSARSLGRNLQGESLSPQGQAVRGQVTRKTTPRTAVYALQDVGQWR